MLLDAIAALVAGSVYATGIVIFSLNLDSIAAWTTPLAGFTFVALTLAVGYPFCRRVRCAHVRRHWRSSPRS